MRTSGSRTKRCHARRLPDVARRTCQLQAASVADASVFPFPTLRRKRGREFASESR
jgi:hypothetical protein